jgi:RimJ/RimL family protein N-acetyltransferase
VNQEMLNVTLRRATADDDGLVERWRNQPSTRRFQASPRRPIEQIRALLAEQAAVPEAPTAVGRVGWIMLLDGKPAGQTQLTINPWDRDHDSATLGYMVADEFQGMGIATAAVRLVAERSFDPAQLAIERIEAVAAVDNLASRRVLEKAGFTFEGVRRGLLRISGERVDHACFGLLKTDLEIQRT